MAFDWEQILGFISVIVILLYLFCPKETIIVMQTKRQQVSLVSPNISFYRYIYIYAYIKKNSSAFPNDLQNQNMWKQTKHVRLQWKSWQISSWQCKIHSLAQPSIFGFIQTIRFRAHFIWRFHHQKHWWKQKVIFKDLVIETVRKSVGSSQNKPRVYHQALHRQLMSQCNKTYFERGAYKGSLW